MKKTQSQRAQSQSQRAQSQSQSQRAQWAWEQIQSVGKEDSEYLTEARKLPARLLTSGVGQTIAYLFSKQGNDKSKSNDKRTGRALLYQQLDNRVQAFGGKQPPSASNLSMGIIVKLGPTEYRQLTRELLATSVWLKRFAEGRIEKKKEDNA